MPKVYLEYCEGVPRLVCTDCGSCNSVMGTSLCSIKDRGCCSYFPEYNLIEIQRLVKLPKGKEVLEAILENPGTVIHNYYLHARGHFEKQAYDQYLEKGDLIITSIKDHTIFFRTCPFVVAGKGCQFESQYRSTVCNFFICSEILENPENSVEFNHYLEERTRYSRWIYRESQELQHILAESSLDLISDFKGCLDLLRELPMNTYEFSALESADL